MKRFLSVVAAVVVVLLATACGSVHQSAPSKKTCSASNETMNCVLTTVGLPAIPRTLVPGQVFGVDFGFGSLSAAAAKSLGAKFVASYISLDPGKDWTYAEVQALHKDGIATVAVWETTSTRAEDGYDAGVDDAEDARALADDLGDRGTIFFAIDCDCSDASIYQYFRGVHATLGSRVGAYGGYSQLAYLHSAGLVGDINWQTYAWSDGKWLPASYAPLEQYDLGSVYDLDRAIAKDYGQWPYVVAPPAPAPVAAPKCKVPDLIGLQLPKTIADLTAANCKRGTVTRDSTKGTLYVVAQSPGTGASKVNGYKVAVTVEAKLEICWGAGSLNNASCLKFAEEFATWTADAKTLKGYYTARKCTVAMRKTNKKGCGSLYTRYRAYQGKAAKLKKEHTS